MDPPTPHDSLVQLVFSQPEHAQGELRRLLPAQISARITWSDLATVRTNFVSDALRGQRTDILYSATIDGTTAVLIYLLFEHQSTVDPLMAYRLLRYMVFIWDDFLRKDPKARKLPPIIPMVLHHSVDGWTSSQDFHALFDLDAGTLALLGPQLPSFQFLLDDISQEKDDALRERAMSALGRLVLFCLRHAREPAQLLVMLGRWLGVIHEAHATGAKGVLAPIWRYIIAVSNPEDPVALVKQLQAVVGPEEEHEIMTAGDWFEERGRKEGRNEGVRATLLKLLRARFGAVPEAAGARIEAADSSQLDEWFDRALGAASLDEVLAS